MQNQQKSKGIEINFLGFFKDLSKKIWLILIIAIITGLGAGIISKFTTKYTYSSNISFIVNTLSENEMAGSSEFSAQKNMANTFRYLLGGRVLKEAIVEACPTKVSYDTVSSSITVNTIQDTNVIELSVTTSDPDISFAIAQTIVEIYDDIVSDIYPNAKLTVCDTPVKATSPTSDRSTAVVALSAFFVGAIAVILILFVLYLIKDTVKSSTELSSKLNIPILGSIQQIINKNKLEKGLLITDKRTGFSFIETYKAIRTKIINHSTKTGDKVYLVTSACENEGKTTVSVNLALSIAETGKSVLLIDADLRNPSVTKNLSLPMAEKGFADVIKGEAKLTEAIKFVNNYNIFVLCDQKPENNPSELLSLSATEDIIKSVRQEFDYIIIDTPPASLVTDTSVIAAMSDAAIVVVREDFAPLSRVRMSIEDIDSNGSEILGCIYNMDSSTGVKRTKYGRYKYGRYNKYYGYGKYSRYSYGSYGYGYGYGATTSTKKKKK